LLLSVFSVAAGTVQGAGLIILEGSDAQTLHGLQPYSDEFMTGFRSFSSASTLPVLVVGSDTVGAPSGNPANKVFLSDLTGLTLADLLGNYSALYIGSPGGCCAQNDAVIAGHEADISGFVAAGRGLTVEDFQGGPAFDSILGFTVDPTKVYGFGTAGGGSGCFDGNTWTPAAGPFLGETPGGGVPNIGCFGHQAYDKPYWESHGFNTQLVKAAPGAVPNADTFVVITNGGGGLAEATVPEPGTLAMLGGALLAVFAGRRKLGRSR
jgi:hypothetical protein